MPLAVAGRTITFGAFARKKRWGAAGPMQIWACDEQLQLLLDDLYFLANDPEAEEVYGAKWQAEVRAILGDARRRKPRCRKAARARRARKGQAA